VKIAPGVSYLLKDKNMRVSSEQRITMLDLIEQCPQNGISQKVFTNNIIFQLMFHPRFV